MKVVAPDEVIQGPQILLYGRTGYKHHSLEYMLDSFQKDQDFYDPFDQIVFDRHNWCMENLSEIDYEYSLVHTEIFSHIIHTVLKLTITNKEAAASFRLLGP